MTSSKASRSPRRRLRRGAGEPGQTAAGLAAIVQLPVMVVAWDKAGRFLAWNAPCRRVLGYSRAEIVGVPGVMAKLFPDARRRRQMVRLRKERLARGESWDWQITCKSGATKTIQWSPGDAGCGAVGWGAWAVGIDVSEREQAMADLSLKHQWIGTAFDRSLTGINVVEHDPATNGFRLVFCNDRYVEMSGRSREELMAAGDLRPFLTSDATKEELAAWHKARLGGKPFQGRSSWIRPDGKENYFEWMAVPHTIRGKRYILGADRDATDRRLADKALADSERSFREVLASSSDLVYRLNLARDTYDYMSPSCKLVTGYTPKEVIALGFAWAARRFDQDDLRRFRRHEQQLLSGEFEHDIAPPIEYRWRHRDGKYHWYRDSRALARDETGAPVAIVGSVQHITEMKEAEQALRDSEQRYRELFENSPVAIVEADFSAVKKAIDRLVSRGVLRKRDLLDYLAEHPRFMASCARSLKVIEANHLALNMAGVASRAELGGNGERFFTERLYETLAEHLAALAAGKSSFQSECTARGARGKLVAMSIHCSLAPEHARDWSRVVVSILDITGLKQAEEALRESELRYRSLFESAPVSLWQEDFSGAKAYLDGLKASGITDMEAHLNKNPDAVLECGRRIRTLDVNEATLRLYGASSKAEFFAKLDYVFFERGFEPFRKLLIDMIAGQACCEVESFNRTLKREVIEVAVRRAPISDDGSWSRVITSVRDITSRKKAERALAAAHKQLLGAREEERRRLARELHDSLGQQLVALHIALSSAISANAGAFDAQTSQSLDAVRNKVNSLIRDVRGLSHGLYPATLESLGLVAALRQLASDANGSARVRLRCSRALESRRFSPEVEIELFRITQEAVNNAHRHGKCGTADIGLALRSGWLTLAVTDDGMGFDVAADHPQGIGLSTMRHRAKAIGGKLSIISQPGATRVAVRVNVSGKPIRVLPPGVSPEDETDSYNED